jgi:hypothetical protein
MDISAFVPLRDEKQVSTKPPPHLAMVSEMARLCSTFSCWRMMITLSGGHSAEFAKEAWAFSAQRAKIFPPAGKMLPHRH